MEAASMETATTPKDYEGVTEYDYGQATPCQKGELRAFGAQLLPPLYSLVFVIGLVGNILVVVVLLQYKKLKSITSIYLLNLAVSDLLLLFTLPFWVDYSLKDNWVFGKGMCKLLSGFYYAGLYGEIFFIILLTIDRYLAIVHAVFALRARTVTFGIISSIVSWVLAIMAALPTFYFSKTQMESTHCTCSLHFPHEHLTQWRQFQALQLNILGLVLPLVIMVVCYMRIIMILLRRPNEMKSKAVRLIFVIMIIFFLFWTPYNLTLFIYAFQGVIMSNECEQSKQLDLALQVTEVVAHTHCCVNPVIYAFVGERFRMYLLQLFRRLRAMLPFPHTQRPEKDSSVSPSTAEHDLSHVF